MNNVRLVHVTAPHATMSDEEWSAIYRKAWDLYYSPEHVETRDPARRRRGVTTRAR